MKVESNKFWYKLKDCQYKLYGEVTVFGAARGVNSIDLNELDAQNIQFYSDSYGTPIGGTVVLYDGQVLMLQVWNNISPNLDRLQRGWDLIYSKYCTGRAKAF